MRSQWRHTRLIFDHAEGPLIRFTYSFSWVLCSNYHNCCAKHTFFFSFFFTAGGWMWACAVREGFQHQTQLMQAGWLGKLMEKEDKWGSRKGGSMGRESNSVTESRAVQVTPCTWSPSGPTLLVQESLTELCSKHAEHKTLTQQKWIKIKYLLMLCFMCLFSGQFVSSLLFIL